MYKFVKNILLSLTVVDRIGRLKGQEMTPNAEMPNTTTTEKPRTPALRILSELSRGTYVSYSRATKELLSNAWDALATDVQIKISEDLSEITILDDWVAIENQPLIGKDVLELLSSAMYIDPLSIYREYVQNAADSIDAAIGGGYTSANLDPSVSRLNPYTNYTARDTKSPFVDIQIYELGNSLAAITGTIPAAYSAAPENNPDQEPGKQLSDCVKNGGPPGQQF